MEVVLNSFSISLISFSLMAFVLSVVVYTRLGSAARWFSACMAVISVWGAAYGIGISQTDLNQMLFWVGVEYIGISLIPVIWFVFVLKFTGRDCKLNNFNMSLMFGFAFLTMIMVWTNPWHQLHYSTYQMQYSEAFNSLKINRGPWYFIHTAFFYALIVSGMVVLFRSLRTSTGVFRKQILVIIIGTIVPWVANSFVVSGAELFNNLDTTPFAFLFTSIIISFGFLRFSLFDIVPMARDKVINAMQEGWLVIDVQNRIIDYNPNMAVILGVKGKVLIGSVFKGFGEQNGNEQLLDTSYEGTVDITVNNDYEVTCKTLRESDSRASGRLFIFRDVTQYKKDQQKLKQQAVELKELNGVKDRLLSIVSHDVRSPLATLSQIIDLYQSGDLDDEGVRELLPSLGENLHAISGFMENLLVWAKSQFDGEKIFKEVFDVSSEVERKIKLMNIGALNKGIKVNYQKQEGDYTAFADLNMTRLVFRNIFGNAIKFCSPGDTITFTLRRQNEMIEVQIEDTGIGISPENQSKLFSTESFSTYGTKNEQGTGLGLMLSKDFVEKNGGQIWVESAPGKGSRFIFTIPVAPKSKLGSQSHSHSY